jgi:hypothetical protein
MLLPPAGPRVLMLIPPAQRGLSFFFLSPFKGERKKVRG